MAQLTIFFYKTLKFKNNETVQNSKSEPKNCNSCVPLTAAAEGDANI
jgi:hypothetical protein